MARRNRKPEDGRPKVRPFWSGTLTFGLVSVPVNLYAAVRSRRPGLRMLDADGAPLERRYYDPETRRNVPWEDVVRGFELENEFVVVEEEELDALAPEKSRDIDLRRFVPAEQLDPIYFDRTYFLAPAGESTKAYRLLAATMEKTGRAGIATFVMRDTEYLTAIIAERSILRAQVLRFPDEVRTPEDIGIKKPRKAPAAEKTRMIKAIRARTEDELDESELEDHWTERLEKLVMRKRRKGEDVVKAPAEAQVEGEDVKVIDLLEVLKKSMAEAGHAQKKPARRAGRRGAEGGAQRAREPARAKDLEALSRDELYERAKALDIPGRSSMSKKQLAAAIRGAA
jgi:DNA end-binding protein Ku